MNNFRSYNNEEVSYEELVELSKLSADPDLVLGWLEESGDYDVRVCDGDLEIDGDFSTSAANIAGLFVRGSLRVAGRYRDTGYPRSSVIVVGDLVARDIVTGGHLEVLGNLHAARYLVGDHNDYGARIAGGVRARLFVPQHHHFAIGGAVDVACAIGDSHRLSENQRTRVRFFGGSDVQLREYLQPNTYYWDEAAAEFDLDLGRLHKRLLQDESVLLASV